MTPSERLLPQQQHPRHQNQNSHPLSHQHLQQHHHQHHQHHQDDHDHYQLRPQHSPHPASPYTTSYPTKDPHHGPPSSLHHHHHHNRHTSPSTPHPPHRHQPGDPHPSIESDAEHSSQRSSSRGSGFGHSTHQDHHSWRQPYPDQAPDRSSHQAQQPHTLGQYPARDHAIGPHPGARDHSSHSYPYHSQPYSSPPSSSYGGAPLGQDHYHSPHSRTTLPHLQEHSSWTRQGPTPPSSSYPQDQSMAQANLEPSTHQPTTPSSDRRYVLTSVNSTATPLVPRRLSISHPSNCSSLEPATVVQPLQAVASSAVVSPQSTSPSSMTQRPPVYGDEQTYMRQVRDNGSPAPLRIRTKLSKDLRGDCPPLSFQSGSSLYMSSKSSDSKMSPFTPRSSQLPSMMAASSLDDPNAGFDQPKIIHPVLPDFSTHKPHFFQSPMDYRDDRQYRDEHDMEHCSEQDDIREREHGDGEDDEDEDDDEGMHARKMPRHHLAMENRIRSPLSRSTRTSQNGEHGTAAAGANDEDEDMEESNSTFASPGGSRKPSLTNSPPRDEGKPSRKTLKSRAAIQKLVDEAVDYEEDGQGQDGLGAQSLHGKGLGYYAPLVCDRVEARLVTTYNDLVQDLAGGDRVDGAPAQEQTGQGNIRRRVYDALNILEALGIISMDKKEIRWIGIQNAKPIREVSRRVQLTNPGVSLQNLQQRERDGADESEEPEDDDMEIEQLQKEVEAMKLRNALELARLEDQVARNVQVNNLIERNKYREEKEMERQIRREQRRLERKEMKRAQAAAGGESMDIDDGGNDPNGAADEPAKRSERRHHRHHRHRSPRLEKEGDECGEMNEGVGEEGDEETARRIKEQQRKERRLRKEQKIQRRQEKEERIQLPLLIVRVPGYAGQSSDSEASISVMRSVRKEQKLKKSGKSKRHCVATGEETTMVEIKIPHQEELSIISDTEILADLGLNEVRQEELHAMLPQDMLNSARYTTKTTDDGCGGENVMVTVRGGFERALVCSAGLY